MVGIGIIGTGTIAQMHLGSLKGSEKGQAVAVFDVLPERAEQTAKQHGIPHVAASLEELLARPDVDAVIVCTPPAMHAEPTIKALQAGKHVLCEKPFALDPKEAEAMVRAAEKAGKYLACCSGRYRQSQAQLRAHAMLEAGELGDVYHVRSTTFRFRGRPGHHLFPASTWFLDKKRAGGGVMMDVAVYQIDSVLWLLGNPKVRSVLAQTRQIREEAPPADVEQDVEDHVAIFMQCEDGRAGIVETSWVANMEGADGLWMLGTKAGLRFEPLRKVTPERVPADEAPKGHWIGDEVYRVVEQKVFPYEGSSPLGGDITRPFVDAVADGRQPMTPGRDALEVTRVIDAAYRSVAEGKAVVLA